MMKKLLLNLGFALLASVTAMAQSTEDAITNIVVSPETLTPGQPATITFDYEFSTAGPGAFIVVFGAAEEAQENFLNWGEAAGVGGWANQGPTISQTTGPTSHTLTFNVPASVPSTADVFAADPAAVVKMLIRMKENANDNESGVANSWTTVTIAAAAASGTISNISYPGTVGIGESFEAIVEYKHTYAENQTLKAFLVKGTIGGDLLWDKGTFGYAEVSLAPGDAMTEVITFNVPPKNDGGVELVPTASLEEGEEWRLVVQAFEKDKGNNPITITAPSNIINDVKNIVIKNESGINDIIMGQNAVVTFDYQLAQASVFSISIVKFNDAFTPSTPEVIATDVVYSDNIEASTDKVYTGSFEYTLAVSPTITKSSLLTDGQNYRVVVKILAGNTTTNEYLSEVNKAVKILDAEGLADAYKAASFTAFPNPVSGNTVNFSKEISNVRVYDFTGNVVATQATATSFETNNLKSGIYMISSDQGTLKVVVE